MKKPLLLSVDWGTSSFRAFLVGDKGSVLDRRVSDMGIMKVPDNDFSTPFHYILKDWLMKYPNIPVMLSGMIGSEQGWSLAPHMKLPAGINDIAGALHAVQISDSNTIHIVPGLIFTGTSGVSDIIRGEETQIIGGYHPKNSSENIFCLPGTHCKWVTVENGIVMDFHTNLTGETLDILTNHSILGRLIEEKNVGNKAAFDMGIKRSGDRGGLLHHLFGVRSQGFTGNIEKQHLKSYLAGILIGHEISGMQKIYPGCDAIVIIAGKEISKVYERAFRIFSIKTRLVDGEEAAILGHWKIARASGLIQGPATPATL